ncbi:Glutamate racemase [compost metagenome]
MEGIEAGDLMGPDTRKLLAGYVEPLLAEGCDTLILGCTHYPFLRPLLHQLVPDSVSLIDTGAAVARQLQRLLDAGGLLAEEHSEPCRFWSSGDPAAMQEVLPILWGDSARVDKFPD